MRIVFEIGAQEGLSGPAGRRVRDERHHGGVAYTKTSMRHPIWRIRVHAEALIPGIYAAARHIGLCH